MGTVFNLTESRHVEFKKGGSVHSQKALKEVYGKLISSQLCNLVLQQICKYGSAFLNSGGGAIYYGVLDNGIVHIATILVQSNAPFCFRHD